MNPGEFREILLRDLDLLSDEINAFGSDGDLWKTPGSIKNSAGNLALHLCGNINHFIGAVIGNSGYIRNRDAEFSSTGITRTEISQMINRCREMVREALNNRNSGWLDENYPVKFKDELKTNGEMLLILVTHFNYHLGQINYARRIPV